MPPDSITAAFDAPAVSTTYGRSSPPSAATRVARVHCRAVRGRSRLLERRPGGPVDGRADLDMASISRGIGRLGPPAQRRSRTTPANASTIADSSGSVNSQRRRIAPKHQTSAFLCRRRASRAAHLRPVRRNDLPIGSEAPRRRAGTGRCGARWCRRPSAQEAVDQSSLAQNRPTQLPPAQNRPAQNRPAPEPARPVRVDPRRRAAPRLGGPRGGAPGLRALPTARIAYAARHRANPADTFGQ